MALNTVMVTGNLVAQPELRKTNKQISVANFRIGVNERFTNRLGVKKETVSFFSVTCWNGTAEHISGLTKGTPVLVEGKLQQRSWEKDGQKRSTVEIVARSVRELARNGRGPADQGEAKDSQAESGGAPALSDDDIPF